MRRFYSLYESMKFLYDDMEQNPTAYSKQKKNEFIASMGKIDKRELLRAVYYLQPLVQGIAICQADTTLQMNSSVEKYSRLLFESCSRRR